jgi:hypothetical protein
LGRTSRREALPRAQAKIHRPHPATVAKLNAMRHGLTAETPVIPGIESHDEWDTFRARLVDALAPVGALEDQLAERFASAAWRLRRVARYEREYIAVSQERVAGDMLVRSLTRAMPRSLAEADQAVAASRGALDVLLAFGTDRVAGVAALPRDHAFAIFQALEDDEFGLPDSGIAGFEDGLYADDVEWTPALMRAALLAIASATGTKGAAIVKRALRAVRRAVADAEQGREELVAEMDRMRRDRMLPEAFTLHALTRYEAHLNRVYFQTLHELEAAQSRRRGNVTPLARIDLHGA